MKHTYHLKPNGFYLFESLSAANSIFFEKEEEIQLFKSLLNRYLKNYLTIHKIYIDITGYQLIVKIKQKRTLLKNYKEDCLKKGKAPKMEFILEPWRIISEKMRVFKSIYVKAVNKLRGREGVMVKHCYKKYYFETEHEYESYVEEMEKGKSIESQKNKRFQLYRQAASTINWAYYRARKWVESLLYWGSQDIVILKTIKSTLLHHNPSHQSHPPL